MINQTVRSIDLARKSNDMHGSIPFIFMAFQSISCSSISRYTNFKMVLNFINYAMLIDASFLWSTSLVFM